MKCKATKKDGTPCSLPAIYADGTCWAHSEENAEKRKRGQSRGGRNKSVAELSALREKLVQLGHDVLKGAVDKGRASVASQAWGVAARCAEAEAKLIEVYQSRLVETGLKVREQQELIERLEELETFLARKEGQRGA